MIFKKEVEKSQEKLNMISKEKDYLIVKAKYGPSKETKIPLNLDENLSFFIASIIGDGHLRKDKFQISIELTNYQLLKEICDISKLLFNREFKINSREPNTNQKKSFVTYIDSKAIYNLLNLVFRVSNGEKSHLVNVPNWIKISSNSVKSAFLIGIMVTEGGRRKRGLGLSTASKTLRDDLVKLMKSLNIISLQDEWIHKKYNKKYYGLSYKKENIELIKSNCVNTEIIRILEKCPNLY